MGAILATRSAILHAATHIPPGRTPGNARLRASFLACLMPLTMLAACASAPHAPLASSPPTATATLTRYNVERFPIEHYDQDVDHWIRPDAPGYDQPLLSAQEQSRRFDTFRARYFGTAPHDPSPWNGAWLSTSLLNAAGAQQIADSQGRRMRRFDNSAPGVRTTYGENFQPHTAAWNRAIEANMALAQLTAGHADWQYDPGRRGITVDNVLVRQLPTNDPAFYDFRQAGEGYPFDALQDSALRPGTPVYTLARSADGAWLLVYSPDLIGWVDARTVASVDERFVATWRDAAMRNLGAIVRADAALADTSSGTTPPVYRTFAPIGTVLPLMSLRDGRQAAMFPVADIHRRAQIRTAVLDASTIVPMPWTLTPRHMAQVMKQQIGRPYGWGNTLFYNDCSAETRSLFAPFGVWLPRHSSDQLRAGKRTDLRAADIDTRLRTLTERGRALMTLIHINGHIMLYLGSVQRDGVSVPMTYQNVWGLSPADNSRRDVIGGSVILPLLKTYPEDPGARSLAGKSLFEISVIGGDIPEAGADAPHAPGVDSPEEMPQ
ncbi:SH3 domain-containing C40 family peptidase [Pandoraea communis]|uniref:Cell wall-associated hydrolase n=1 Tax=Pandoraea communis TaxID=2508297 RepID=A0A5E4SB48_9BURK|nr:SH3 domain-containing C40 family peptidase [Pandoraea communis]MDM8354736.1 NlpC/P60 family N-terminal domain-containing protein [Pandoraea communis]VVD72837.1 cell wall-associated hydrolase [Pandoraea communis]